jgi:hypothetical protein
MLMTNLKAFAVAASLFLVTLAAQTTLGGAFGIPF